MGAKGRGGRGGAGGLGRQEGFCSPNFQEFHVKEQQKTKMQKERKGIIIY